MRRIKDGYLIEHLDELLILFQNNIMYDKVKAVIDKAAENGHKWCKVVVDKNIRINPKVLYVETKPSISNKDQNFIRREKLYGSDYI